ncbi:hypothetical protein T492DRAFT_1077460 [Pavlovales sp. CCMP2436]|nr:hypothetical protein T492DRAFT_1077460 [Pavlovales sp. CCMP2436]
MTRGLAILLAICTPLPSPPLCGSGPAAHPVRGAAGLSPTSPRSLLGRACNGCNSVGQVHSELGRSGCVSRERRSLRQCRRTRLLGARAEPFPLEHLANSVAFGCRDMLRGHLEEEQVTQFCLAASPQLLKGWGYQQHACVDHRRTRCRRWWLVNHHRDRWRWWLEAGHGRRCAGRHGIR